jgi:signal transduction histidine kinase/CheY-like chemotaxis protein
MKFVRKKSDGAEIKKLKLPPWKVLIVDDEPDVHSMTSLSLQKFKFAGKNLQIFQAVSGIEAQEILAAEPNMAVALIDIVMETDDAGLRLVDFIRNELKYSLIRLIIRTGQPGMAPEKEVIERYDIDDYKDKTELTAQKLYTAMRTALKSYRDLSTLDANRKGLRKILDAAPELYHPQSINQFFNGVLTQIIGLCNLGENSLISTVNNGLVIAANNNQIAVQSGTGRFAKMDDNPEVKAITKTCLDNLLGKPSNEQLPPDALMIPLEVHKKPMGFVYLENAQHLSKADQDIIYIMVNQCATALENLQLYLELKEANRQTSYMLSIAEQARKMAEAANSAKSTFLAQMSHELRTPLNAILGYSDMIQEEALDSGCEELLPDLDKVQMAGRELLDIISNILDISKIEADKLELNLTEFAVTDLINEVVTTIQPIVKIKGNRLKLESGNKLGTLYADYHKVKQVLFNILNNAVKFTNEGTITFTITRHQKIPPPELNPLEKGKTDGGEGKTEPQSLSKGETEHTHLEKHEIELLPLEKVKTDIPILENGKIEFPPLGKIPPLKNGKTEFPVLEKDKTEFPRLKTSETQSPPLEKEGKEAFSRLKTSETQSAPLEKEGKDALSDWLFFQIADTGIGIPSEKLNMVFEAFTQADNSTTREFGGTGLGLAISEHFCKTMGGKISVCSTQGEGTTFTVQLPAQVSVK